MAGGVVAGGKVAEGDVELEVDRGAVGAANTLQASCTDTQLQGRAVEEPSS